MMATPIVGEKLTTWGVLPGETQIALEFAAVDGGTHRIVLPVDALSGLMTTLPRMLQSALDERSTGGNAARSRTGLDETAELTAQLFLNEALENRSCQHG